MKPKTFFVLLILTFSASNVFTLANADEKNYPPSVTKSDKYYPEALQLLLDRITVVSQSGGRPPIVIFDLDETLIDTGPMKTRITREFLSRRNVRETWPREAALAQDFLRAPKWGYSMSAALRSIGAENREFLDKFRQFAAERFFSDEYKLEHVAIPGAPEYVREAKRRGAVIFYLTARRNSEREGTVASLDKLKIPVPDDKQVFLTVKEKEQDTPEYKMSQLDRISAMGQVVGGFENEPQNANIFKARFPDALIVFVDMLTSGAIDPKTGRPFKVLGTIPWIADFTYH